MWHCHFRRSSSSTKTKLIKFIMQTNRLHAHNRCEVCNRTLQTEIKEKNYTFKAFVFSTSECGKCVLLIISYIYQSFSPEFSSVIIQHIQG